MTRRLASSLPPDRSPRRLPRILGLGLCLALLALLPTCGEEESGGLPDLATFSFNVTASKVIKGDKSTEDGGSIPGCAGTIDPADTLGNLALVSVFKISACYTDPEHTHGDYTVQQGTLDASNGAYSLPAYSIHEPFRKATKFLGSPHAVYYKFPTAADYTVYEFSQDDGSFSVAATVPEKDIAVGKFVRVYGLEASAIVGKRLLVFAPSSLKINRFTPLGPGVEGARVGKTALGDVLKYRYTVTATPFDTAKDYAAGPGSASNRYGQNRKYFFVGRDGEGRLGLLWQDQQSGALQLTRLAPDRRSLAQTTLPGGSSEMVLAAACGGEGGVIYYFLAELGDGSPNTARKLAIYKVDAGGILLKQASPAADKGKMNAVSFASSLKLNRYPATMRQSGDTVALMIGRKMHQGSDGLNHQGGIAVVFDAQTLEVLRNHGQTSGHSFGNVLTVESGGDYLGIDLGDNYPRGVHLHRFNQTKRLSRVVYTFKTRHGTSAQNPAGKTFPKYEQASTAERTYYQWSNDNDTYTELGGVVETDAGYLVFFTGEAPPLDNSKVGSSLNAPRNVGYVLVRRDFEKAASGARNVVPDDLVKSAGAAETGGFYDFNGRWNEQRNKGVVWLTSYSDMTKQNASRLRAVPLGSGEVLLIWEVWTASAYVSTFAQKVDGTGKALGAAVELPKGHVRLGRRDEPLHLPAGGEVLLAAGAATGGNETGGTLELVVLRP